MAKIAYARSPFSPAEVVSRLTRTGTDIVFFLGSGEEGRAVMKEAQRLSWAPTLFLAGSLVGREPLDVPPNFKNRLFLFYPTAPSAVTSAGATEYRALLDRHQVTARYPAFQLVAYAAAKTLVEGLKLAGRDLSRDKLVTALEGLYD